MVEPNPNQEKISVTWEEFDEGVKALLYQISKEYKDIYAPPRGGLPLGVILSHNISIPLLLDESDISEETLIVDDISDRGVTLKELLEGKSNDVAVLYEREGTVYEADYVFKKLNHDKWLIFPWEKQLS